MILCSFSSSFLDTTTTTTTTATTTKEKKEKSNRRKKVLFRESTFKGAYEIVFYVLFPCGHYFAQ